MEEQVLIELLEVRW